MSLLTILHLLEQLQAKITDDSDVVWTRFDTPAALRAELEGYIEQLKGENTSCLKQIDLHFGPTSTFQEHAISNGWGEEYLQLAAAFDKAYASFLAN